MTDYTEYKELYLKCFTEDTEEDAEFIFKTVLAKAEKVCRYDHNGHPIAMLFLMDSDLIAGNKKYPFFYLYAACTHPDHRGKGIMGELLNEAKEIAVKNGKQGIFLKPANPPLFDFYARSDFKPFFNVTKINCSSKEFLKSATETNISVNEISLSEWHIKRRETLSDLCDVFADFSIDLFTAATGGCKAVIYNNAAAVYELRNSTLLIKEAFCPKNGIKELLNLICHLLKNSSAENIELRLPAVYNKIDFADLHPETTHFSVIWQKGDFPLQDFITPYHGFAFD